jgi:hypothetical protein
MRADALGFTTVVGVSLLLLPLLVDPHPLAARAAVSLAEATSPAGLAHLCAATAAKEHAGAGLVRSEDCAHGRLGVSSRPPQAAAGTCHRSPRRASDRPWLP